MSASVVGFSSARRRTVGAVSGVSAVEAKRRSVAMAGPTMSSWVSGGPSPSAVKRSPASRVFVGLLVEHDRVPAVRDVRGRQEAHALAAEVEHLAVRERARRPVGLIPERDHAADLALRGRRLRGRGQPLVERAALVGLEVAVADPAQARERHDPRQRLADPGIERAHAGVEQQRLLGVDQDLVEREPALRGERREPVDAGSDLVGTGHAWSPRQPCSGEQARIPFACYAGCCAERPMLGVATTVADALGGAR